MQSKTAITQERKWGWRSSGAALQGTQEAEMTSGKYGLPEAEQDKQTGCCERRLPPTFPLLYTCYPALYTQAHTHLPRPFGSQFISWTW